MIYISAVLLIVFVVFIAQSIRIVPQQSAWVIERLGKYHRTLESGMSFLIPFVDRVAYKHSLKETPLDVAPQVCITKDNTQLQVDGILYLQVTDPVKASYGSSNYILAVSQLAQTTLRSVIGRLELDKTFEERAVMNTAVIQALEEASSAWGVKLLRYEIKDLTPPSEILRSMQAQITAEREKRALIAKSEGEKAEAINIAAGEREAAIAQSEGDRISQINKAEGEAQAILSVARATAESIELISTAMNKEGGRDAVNLQVAERYIDAFANLAKTNNTLIIPANAADVSGMLATAMSTLKTLETKGK